MYGTTPTYVATGFYNAAKLLVKGIENAEIKNTPAQSQKDRDRLRDALETIKKPDSSVSGLNGSLYFDRGMRLTKITILFLIFVLDNILVLS